MGPHLRFRAALVLTALALATLAAAQSSTPVGTWRTTDDKTGETKSLVRITEVDGKLQGTIGKIFAPPAPSDNPRCEKCPDARRNQPLVGMVILWGFERDGDEWDGGRVLDPESGKIYRGKLRLMDDGRKLELRGYVGLPIFGRSQTWVRE